MLLKSLWSLGLLLHGVKAGFVVTPVSELIAKMDARTHAQVEEQSANSLRSRNISPRKLYKNYTLDVPVDHFHNDSKYAPHSDETFKLKYYLDDSHYKPGGPIIVLCGGETDIDARLPFMQKGILAKLASATGGMSVLLEHRYYGESFPVPNLSVKNLRFLTTDQALADAAYFAKHVKFPGYEKAKLNAPETPWIAYGGSYAGAFAAFLRKLYPDTWFGAISSSGVTEAIYDYWRYFDAARLFSDKKAIETQQDIVAFIDKILTTPKYYKHSKVLRKVLHLQNLTRDDDLANTLTNGITGLQSTNWDPNVTDTSYNTYLHALRTDKLLFPKQERLRRDVEKLLRVTDTRLPDAKFVNRFLNFVGWNYDNFIESCKSGKQDECFSAYGQSTYERHDLASQGWRSWAWQYCTEWGYMQTGSGTPAHIRPVVSRLVNLNITTVPCREGFNIHRPANTSIINKHGGFGISYPRLAIVDGNADPWRQATPHALGRPDRKSTISEPYILIEGGAVHHWDENGLFANETTDRLPPKYVREAQEAEVMFVKEWLKDFKKPYGSEATKALRYQRPA